MDIAAPSLIKRMRWSPSGHVTTIADGQTKNFFYRALLTGRSIFHSQRGKSYHERRVGQTQRVQDEIEIVSDMTMA
jgi:hypothetical protein